MGSMQSCEMGHFDFLEAGKAPSDPLCNFSGSSPTYGSPEVSKLCHEIRSVQAGHFEVFGV